MGLFVSSSFKEGGRGWACLQDPFCKERGGGWACL